MRGYLWLTQADERVHEARLRTASPKMFNLARKLQRAAFQDDFNHPCHVSDSFTPAPLYLAQAEAILTGKVSLSDEVAAWSIVPFPKQIPGMMLAPGLTWTTLGAMFEDLPKGMDKNMIMVIPSAPGHTDLMISPEAIDEALAAAPIIPASVEPDLCQDEGCPHTGTPHVCNPPAINFTAEELAAINRAIDRAHTRLNELIKDPSAPSDKTQERIKEQKLLETARLKAAFPLQLVPPPFTIPTNWSIYHADISKLWYVQVDYGPLHHHRRYSAPTIEAAVAAARRGEA